jgi:hypothetical protein
MKNANVNSSVSFKKTSAYPRTSKFLKRIWSSRFGTSFPMCMRSLQSRLRNQLLKGVRVMVSLFLRAAELFPPSGLL